MSSARGRQRLAALVGASLILRASVYVQPAAYLLLPALLAGATVYALVGSKDRRQSRVPLATNCELNAAMSQAA